MPGLNQGQLAAELGVKVSRIRQAWKQAGITPNVERVRNVGRYTFTAEEVDKIKAALLNPPARKVRAHAAPRVSVTVRMGQADKDMVELKAARDSKTVNAWALDRLKS